MVKGCKLLSEVDVNGKRVFVRGDLDVEDGDNPRVESVRNVVKDLIARGAGEIKVAGHRETDFPICEVLRDEFEGVLFDDGLRINPGEKSNDKSYAQLLADGWDIYVNEAFATSHRNHASLVALPEVFKEMGREAAIGPRFAQETEMLDGVIKRLEDGVNSVLVIGGVKIDDKQKFAVEMASKFTAVLKGGLLPDVDLREDGLDISADAIFEYERQIALADLILAAGVMGKYEEESSSEGTRKILEAIAKNDYAYKIAGGGDIETAISRYGLSEKFNWISVGGGAMLVYISTGTLPALEVLK
jgi:phosphoglycerate kinase